eukprot:1003976_1
MVTYESKVEYADLVEKYRLTEFDKQIDAIIHGLNQIIPVDIVALLSWKQLEEIVTGKIEIDIALLKEKTVYVGNVTGHDHHIVMFWEVLEGFSNEERKLFLQFVWGRSRLPSTKVGFGKDVMKVSDHLSSLTHKTCFGDTSGDSFLPVAHTCFFSLELPRYSSKKVLKDKLLYAIYNCKTIDADATHEGMRNLNMSWSESDSDD